MDVEEIKSLVEQSLNDRGIKPAMEEGDDTKKEEREAEEGDFGRSSK
jgi:hypothetical protein